ncbi:hypothetical protein CKAH01_05957 [Colletotrichum kahawae]|uniref:Uncharacterized protein n=1 Tax=Colletotrichum kahawae TaxID=34407 RepID=A0AAD9YDM9_COLKA|nr:hypothetical protein CKAH01_05957 [Colletotrichum kahawae]
MLTGPALSSKPSVVTGVWEKPHKSSAAKTEHRPRNCSSTAAPTQQPGSWGADVGFGLGSKSVRTVPASCQEASAIVSLHSPPPRPLETASQTLNSCEPPSVLVRMSPPTIQLFAGYMRFAGAAPLPCDNSIHSLPYSAVSQLVRRRVCLATVLSSYMLFIALAPGHEGTVLLSPWAGRAVLVILGLGI